MSKENVEKEMQEDLKETVEETTEKAEQKVSEETKESSEKETDNTEEKEETKDDSEDKKTKKKIFGNKKDKKDQMIEELTDRNQRLMAEFQNFRNRSEKEKSAMFEVGAKTIIEKILPVVDNFERGISSLSEDDLNSPVGQGITMIYKQFTTALEEMGVEVIKTEGCEFDPELHNAVMHVEDEELGENIIAEEFQKGYTYRGTVVRHSMVKVAN